MLAAGRGSRLGRIGDELPKCLLPLDGQAVLSRQFRLAPKDARLIVVIGYRADQVKEYTQLAHPHLDVTFVFDDKWGSGPGVSLLAARDAVGDDDMVFVACDTLWEQDHALWDNPSESWVATAPIPAGTPAARWCRIVPHEYGTNGIGTLRIDDKTPDVTTGSLCWTALAYVASEDLEIFWSALLNADTIAGEVQLSSGLQAIVDRGEPLWVRSIQWLDVGDEQAYRNALAAYAGYDPLKPDQITYVNQCGRVVKWHVDPDKMRWRVERAKLLDGLVPTLIDSPGITMTAYDYVPGASLYDLYYKSSIGLVNEAMDWWTENFWSTRHQHVERPFMYLPLTMKFYRDKTFTRVMSLDMPLQSMALDAITRVDWDELVDGVIPGTFHGDFTYANVIAWDDDWNTKFTSIDWREDFAGVTTWGDLRYDLGKLLSGTMFQWQNAAHGDFRRWPEGLDHRKAIESYIEERLEVDILAIRRIAALCLINSAALHASPMDEILIARGTRWLTEVT